MKRDGHNIFMTALLILPLALILNSCGGGGGSIYSSWAPFIVAELVSFPTGSVPSGLTPFGFNSMASVFVIDDYTGKPIPHASVTINGVMLTYNSNGQDYEGNLTVVTGERVTLSVTVSGNTYTAAGTQFTSYPAISTPVTGESWHTGYDSTIMWSGGAPAAYAYYGLGIVDASDPKGSLVWPPDGFIKTVALDTTSYSIPANSLAAGSRHVVVGIMSDVNIPDAAFGSALVLSGFNYVPMTIATNAALLSLAVTPADPSVAKGLTRQLKALGTFSDSSIQDLTTQASWVSADTTKAGFWRPGLVYGGGVGTSNITATLGNFSGSTTLTVTPAVLVDIEITPRMAVLAIGASQQFTAWGDLSDGTPNRIVTESMNWSSSNEAVASISNAAGSLGQVTIMTSGTTTITATAGTMSDSTTLTVTDWTLRNSGTTNSLHQVVWSGSQYVTVGNGGAILTSSDGATWQSQASGSTKYLTSVAWSGTLYVAVGDSGTILTSPDGVSWTSRSSGTTALIYDVVWSGSQFVAVGWVNYPENTTILRSPDGVTWTSSSLGNAGPLQGVVWSGTQFVAVGYSDFPLTATIFTSTDGITWTPIASGVKGHLHSVAWSGTQFVAVGPSYNLVNTILTSPDGVTWTLRTAGPEIFTLFDIIWAGSKFVAVGFGGDILTSPDGVVWTYQASHPVDMLTGVAWSGTQLVSVGFLNGGAILTSPGP